MVNKYLEGLKENEIRYYDKENSIIFNSKEENFVMSNMYPCKLLYNGIVFYSVEQLYHWMLYSHNPRLRNRILEFKGICNGFDVKKFCKDYIKERDGDFDSKKYRCLRKCLELKYLQCYEFRKAIDESGSKNLVEYAPWDSEYGTTWLKEYNAYVGKNACGRIMMEVRKRHSKV